MIKSDIAVSMRFIGKEQTSILKILLLSAAMNFLLVGIGVVGLPYIIRTVFGLSAAYYGAAESLMGLAAILGSVAAGLLVTRLKTRKLYWLLLGVGAAILPIAIAFLLAGSVITQYVIVVASVFIIQFLALLFSIFALSILQQKTPNKLIGKVMAYVSTISLCAQPLGQMLYGFLFDAFSQSLFWVFLITGIATYGVALLSKSTFYRLDGETAPPDADAPIASGESAA